MGARDARMDFDDSETEESGDEGSGCGSTDDEGSDYEADSDNAEESDETKAESDASSGALLSLKLHL